RYLAFVLPAGSPDEVTMIDLGDAEPLDRLIADFRAALASRAENGRKSDVQDPCDTTGRSLRVEIFDKIAPTLGRRTRLLIAPDGDLAHLPFEILPLEDGRRLLD